MKKQIRILLALLLIALMALFACGKGDVETNTENSSQSTEDNAAPKVTMKSRYIFTNDIAKLTDFSSLVNGGLSI